MLGKACGFKSLLLGEIHSQYEEEDYLDQERIVIRPIETGLDPHGSISGEPFLHIAASYINIWRALNALLDKDHKGIELVVGRHASTSARNADGEMPLYYAAFVFGIKDFRLYLPVLRDRRLLVQPNDRGESLLHYAAAGANVDVIEYLLDNGLHINVTNHNGWTPFMCALVQTSKGVYKRGSSP
ncbi:ankyrin repeat-containing domain protein [Hypoxylon cercidicola]|nr:ankyrin repeat-containing domain protein [Hypoxylon cercidicola]